MVISEIKSLYRDENDLLRTVIKRIYEKWDACLKQWDLIKIELLFHDPECPLRSESLGAAVEYRHGWLVPPDWEFVSEVMEFERRSR